MDNIRKYGNEPFAIAVIHGGPGAAGEMKPVAEELSKNFGILEPLQTATSLEEQVQELKSVLEEHGDVPATLIGYSWGAWLAYILAARYPELVRKLILVGSGPFETEYTTKIIETRLSRLSDRDKQEAQSLREELQKGSSDKSVLERFGKLISQADSYKPIPHSGAKTTVQQSIYESVWPEASELRKNGGLLQLGEEIKCPVVAIHGAYDPHPAAGVQEPLSKVVKDFRFVLLDHCGHKPWIEEEAKEQFYKIIRKEVAMPA